MLFRSRRYAATRSLAAGLLTLSRFAELLVAMRVLVLRTARAVERFAIRIRHEFELHSPRGEEVHPALALVCSAARRRPTEDGDSVLAQARDGYVEILQVKRHVVTTDVAVARLDLRWPGAE